MNSHSMFQKNRCAGFSLIGVMVASTLAVGLLFATISISNILAKQQLRASVTFQSEQIRRDMYSLLNHNSAWDQTIRNAGNSRANGPALNCLIPSGTPCTNNGLDLGNPGALPITNQRINVLTDSSGTIRYNLTSQNNGFSIQGNACANFVAPPGNGRDSCPLQFTVTWSAICDTSCINPQVRFNITPVYNPSPLPARRVAFNASAYGARGFRGTEGRTVRIIGMVEDPGGPPGTPGARTVNAGAQQTIDVPSLGNPNTTIPFTVNSPLDIFSVSASARVIFPGVENNAELSVKIFIGTGTCTNPLLGDVKYYSIAYQSDPPPGAANMQAAGSGSLLISGLQAGNYTLALCNWASQAGNRIFIWGRQLSLYQFD